MGLFDFAKRRRQRESAVPPPSSEVDPLASKGDEPVVGQRFQAPAAGGLDLSSLGGLAGLAQTLQQGAAQGNVDVSQTSQTLDLRGTGLREEIVEIMKRHGIDPDSGAVQGAQIDASSMPQMQAEILQALGRHGVNTGGANIQIQPTDPSD